MPVQDPRLQLLRGGSAHRARCADVREMKPLTFASGNPPAATLAGIPSLPQTGNPHITVAFFPAKKTPS